LRDTDQKINNQRAHLSEIISGKVEKKKLLFEDQMENDRRLKMMRLNFHSVLMTKHQMKEKKIGEMKRIMINHKKEPIDALYSTLHV
jgi:hypothetical protein